MSLFLVFAMAVGLNAVATILLKMGVSRLPDINIWSWSGVWSIISSWYILLGLVLYAVSFPAYSFLLQKLNVNIAYPIFTSASFATVVVISFLFLKESLTILQLFGLILVVGGIVLLATNGAK